MKISKLFFLITLVLSGLFIAGTVVANTTFSTISEIQITQDDTIVQPEKLNICHRAGCSGELCVEGTDPGFSFCVFLPEYGCYYNAECKRQADGVCGWTQTEELTQCIQEARNPSPIPSSTPNNVCGNNLCEAGEFDFMDCPVCVDGIDENCPIKPCNFIPGSCPQDCSTVVVSPTPIMTVSPLSIPTPTLYPEPSLSPVPSFIASPLPLPTQVLTIVKPSFWPGEIINSSPKPFPFNLPFWQKWWGMLRIRLFGIKP